MVRQIPNIITMIRIILTLTFAYLYLQGVTVIATVILIVAMASDLADGHIARRYGLQTRLGEILDPISDKLSTIVVCSCLYIKRLAPLWFILALMVKELAMLVLGMLCMKRKIRVLGAKWYGKAATLITNVVICFNLIFSGLARAHPRLPLVMYAAAIVMAYFAFVNYVIAHLKLARENSDQISDAGETM